MLLVASSASIAPDPGRGAARTAAQSAAPLPRRGRRRPHAPGPHGAPGFVLGAPDALPPPLRPADPPLPGPGPAIPMELRGRRPRLAAVDRAGDRPPLHRPPRPPARRRVDVRPRPGRGGVLH